MWCQAFKAITVVNGETETSRDIALYDGMDVHAFEYNITGSGTLDISVETSISGVNWINNGIKAADVGATSGPGSDGNDIIPLSLKPGDMLRIKCTASGDDAVISMFFTQK